MLAELSIENLALIERTSLVFGPGLNVITGETGAGKSLLVGALELLLGQRPKTKLLRQGAERARVEGRFFVQGERARKEVGSFLAEHLPQVAEEWQRLDEDERELILSRTLTHDGRTRAYVDQRPVNQRILRDLASRLVEIHGQNDHQKLLEPGVQTVLLDAFCNTEKKLEVYREKRRRWQELQEYALRWQSEESERRDRHDLLKFQVHELEQAQLSVEERAKLEGERQVLRHAAELGTQVGGLLAGLCDAEGSAFDSISSALRISEGWQERVSALGPVADQLRTALLHLEEAGSGLRAVVGEIDFSPERLDAVEGRLAEIERLERKHHTDVAGLIDKLHESARELETLEGEETGREESVQLAERARLELEQSAQELFKARRKFSKRIERAVSECLGELGLEQASFEVQIEERLGVASDSPNADPAKADTEAATRRYGPTGIEDIEFLLAANPGEGLAPLRQVASGGETARIMLALRKALAVRQTIPTLVFDEIDAGVGGHLGPRVGAYLAAVSEHHQILCVTHLAAVAARAHTHLNVVKEVRAGRTRTQVLELAERERVAEVANMLAGGGDQETARAEARRLLGLA